MKKNENGFVHIGSVLVALTLVIITGAGLFVLHKNKEHQKTVVTPQVQLQSDQKNTQTQNSTKTLGEAGEYCDSVEKMCVSYDNTWTKQTEKFQADDPGEHTKLILTSTSYSGLKVSLQPYIYGVGGSCQEGNIIALTAVKNAPGLSIVQSYVDSQEFRDGKPFGPASFSVGMSVQDTGTFKVGKVDCVGLGLFSNTNYGTKGVVSSLVALPNKYSFGTEQEAKAWFDSGEAKAAKQVLQTLSINK